MNRESKLHGNIICSECENLIKALEDEILNFDEKIEALKDFANNESEGEAAKAINEKSLELASVIGIMKEADEKDIEELKALADIVNDIFIDGDDVIERKETARREADSCYDRADSLWSAAQKAEFPWEADSLRGLASASKSQGDSWERIYEFWKGQEELYDTIDFETSSLFATGIGLRRQANTKLASFLQCRLNSPDLNKAKTKKISKPVVTNKDTIYKFVHDYLKKIGFTEEQIEYIYKTKPELFSSLYATAHYSTADCPAIVQNMRDELDKVKEKYHFVLEDIQNRWGISEEEAFEILFKLEKAHKLESLYGTYYHSQNDYYSLLNNLDADCNIWVEDNIDLLNTYSDVADWSEDEKRRVLKEYYWKYIFDSFVGFSLTGGAANTIEKDVGFDWNKAKDIYENNTIELTIINFDNINDVVNEDYNSENIISNNESNAEYAKNILSAIGWDYSDEEIEELGRILQNFGITDRYSILCFLLCCNHEKGWKDSGRTGENSGKYYDSHDYLISEDYDSNINHDYSENERGIGYIQVTYKEQQRKAYEYLLENNYINQVDKDEIYLDELSQNPWAVSAWYWSKLPRTSDGLSLNDYVNKVLKEADFSYGLLYTCEAFVYGVIESDEENEAYHEIARGADFYVKDNKVFLVGNKFLNDVRSIQRSNEFRNAYEKIENR